MYHDLTTDELQAWLLSQSISDDAILASEDVWQAAQVFREHIQDCVAARQYDDDFSQYTPGEIAAMFGM